MDKDLIHIVSDFRNRTSKMYEQLFSDFKHNVFNLSRQKDENVYQQILARYSYLLKKRLEYEAHKIVESNRGNPAAGSLQQELTGHISYLLSEFRVKAGSM